MDDVQGQPVSTDAADEEQDLRALNGDGQPIDGTRKNPDGTVTLFLERPITVMKEPVDKITMRRPTGKQMRGLDAEKGEVTSSLKYLAAVANIPAPCVDTIDGADIKAAGEVLAGFMRKTRVAGGN